ncbi:nuclear transport factor 2 family protein [Salmonella enterica]|uniref:nuclear transport factor 2 family protein n=1 Tax=Salmonella enterica TaxID=28901 RepID=UPI00158FDB51|nr:nuclear transport factor 2 family protein [Salmonella enterica]
MMTTHDAELKIINALRDIVCQQQHDETQIARYFSDEYQQQVDGKCIDYKGFIAHMELLKKLTCSINVSVLAIAAKNNDVLTHHRVYVEKKNGSRSVIDVLAHFTLRDNLIIRCEELTRQLEGDADDRDLGSRC